MLNPRYLSRVALLLLLLLPNSACNSDESIEKKDSEKPPIDLPLNTWAEILIENLKSIKGLEIRKAEKDNASGSFSIEIGEEKGANFILYGKQAMGPDEKMMIEANLHMILDQTGQLTDSQPKRGIGFNSNFPPGFEPPIPFKQEMTQELSCILHMVSGVISVLEGDTATANRQFDQALESCPGESGGENLFLAHYFKGQFELQKENYDVAADHFESALLSSPADTLVKSYLERLIERIDTREFVYNRLDSTYGRKSNILNARNLVTDRRKFEENVEEIENIEWDSEMDAPSDADSIYYQRIDRFGRSYFRVLSGGDFGIVDQQGKEIVPPEYLWIELPSEGIAWIRKDSLFGYIKVNGEWLVPLQYQFAGDFSNGLGLIKKNGKYGYLDTKGREIIPAIYEDAERFQEDRGLVKINGVYGFIDQSGKYIVEPQFSFASLFINGLSLVEKNEKTGLLEKDGSWALQTKYQSGSWMNDDFILLKNQGKNWLYDVKNRSLEAQSYDKIEDLGAWGFKVRRDNKYGLLELNGGEGLPLKFEMLEPVGKNLLKGKVKNGWVLIALSKNGNSVFESKYQQIGEEFEGRIQVKNQEKYGFIDKMGSISVPIKYDSVGNYFSEMVTVWENGRERFVDLNGKCILNCD